MVGFRLTWWGFVYHLSVSASFLPLHFPFPPFLSRAPRRRRWWPKAVLSTPAPGPSAGGQAYSVSPVATLMLVDVKHQATSMTWLFLDAGVQWSLRVFGTPWLVLPTPGSQALSFKNLISTYAITYVGCL